MVLGLAQQIPDSPKHALVAHDSVVGASWKNPGWQSPMAARQATFLGARSPSFPDHRADFAVCYPRHVCSRSSKFRRTSPPHWPHQYFQEACAQSPGQQAQLVMYSDHQASKNLPA
eukprot:364930-Chlamydomonas_euryale.AAC.8